MMKTAIALALSLILIACSEIEHQVHEDIECVVISNRRHVVGNSYWVTSNVRTLQDSQIVALDYFAGDKGDTIVYTHKYFASREKPILSKKK